MGKQQYVCDSNNKDRLQWIDVEKGIAILLVVIGHLKLNLQISSDVSYIIYKFHMPLFMMISGYITSMAYVKDGILRKWKLIIQILNSYVVYFIFSGIYCILKIITHQGNTAANIKDLVLIFYRPIGHYWYIYTTVLLDLLFYVFWKYIRNNKIGLLMFLVEVVIFRLQYINVFTTIIPINYLVAWLPYWHFGIILHINKEFLDDTIRKYPIDIVISILIFILSVCWKQEVFFVSSLLIAYGVFELVYRYWNFLWPNGISLLSYFGKNSLSIYLIHSYFTHAFTFISGKILVLPAEINYLICCVGIIWSLGLCSSFITKKMNVIINPIKCVVKRN